MQREMKNIALAVAFKTLLGLDLTPAGERLRTLVEAWMRVSFDPAALLLPFDIPGLPFHRQLRLSARVERALGAMIAYKRRTGADRGDVLAMLMQAHDEDGSSLSDAELIAHTLTLFVAGHETTANALTWTLFLLAQHPAVLADLRDELAGLGGAAPALDQIDSLPLLDRVIKESLRLLPPAIFLLRVAMAEEPFGAYTIPQGSFLFYSPPITHRLPDLYPQAERFDPARWETIHPNLYEYLPFAAGPRMCIGATFAHAGNEAGLAADPGPLHAGSRRRTTGGPRPRRVVGPQRRSAYAPAAGRRTPAASARRRRCVGDCDAARLEGEQSTCGSSKSSPHRQAGLAVWTVTVRRPVAFTPI